MQGYCDVYIWAILKRTSPEVKCLHPTSSRREMCTLSVSNVIYHKFSHGSAFCRLNGRNVNVMLELQTKYVQSVCDFPHGGSSGAALGGRLLESPLILQLDWKTP